MSNKYLEKIAKRVSTKRVRKLYDDGKEVYDESKDILEVKKRLTKKNNSKANAGKAVDRNAKRRVSISGRKWNRAPAPKGKN